MRDNNNNQNNKNVNEVSKNVMQKATVWLMKNTATLFLGIIVLVFVYHFILMMQYASNLDITIMNMFGLIVSFLTDAATMLGLYAVLITNREKFFSKADASEDEKSNSDSHSINTGSAQGDISATSDTSTINENSGIIDIMPVKKTTVNTEIKEDTSSKENQDVIDILPIKKS